MVGGEEGGGSGKLKMLLRQTSLLLLLFENSDKIKHGSNADIIAKHCS